MENNEKIAVLLKVVGVSPSHLGWKYLKEAIKMALEDETVLERITKEIYPSVAKKFNSTPSRVERAIRHSIVGAFMVMPSNVKYEIFRNTISDNRNATNGEFIGTLAELIAVEPNNPIWARAN